ncbi:MAG TPA: DUF3772 domain-containing protein, partial [Hyphomicrobiaceae bacterium]|nr:DUF3772 domain-containing protein [Hyphomicrobiaceae bacterium]
MRRKPPLPPAPTALRTLIALLIVALVLCAFPHRQALAQNPPSPAGTQLAPQTVPDASTTPDTPAAAATPAPPPANDPLYPAKDLKKANAFTAELIRLSKAVERVKASDADLATQRTAIEKLQASALEIETKLKPALEAVDSQIQRLGEKPKDGAPPESEALARDRARLDRIRAEIAGATKTANLAQLRASQLIGRVQELRLNNFTRNLFERRTSPLAPTLWRELGESLPRIARQFRTIFHNWWAVAKPNQGLLWLVLITSIAAYIAMSRLRSRILNAVLAEPQPNRLTFFKRSRTAIGLVPLMMLPALGAAFLGFGGFHAFSLINNQIHELLVAALVAISVFKVVTALARAVLLPNFPSWRLVGIPDHAAQHLVRLTGGLAAVFAADMFLDNVIRALFLPFVVGMTETFAANTAFAILLSRITWVNTANGTSDSASGQLIQTAFRWLRVPGLLVAFAIIGATLFGYYAFGRFLASQVTLIASVATIVLLCHLAIRAWADLLLRIAKTKGYGPDEADGTSTISQEATRQILRGAAAILNAILLTLAASFLLVSWGFSSAELISWAKSLFFGFEVGQYKISLFRILIAVALFIGLILFTRLFQGWMSTKVLTPKRVDAGIANSVRQGIGYAGVTLAALVGISHLGLDVSNLTIVAGALSVGIGFGMQSIVNNFVSGLIL